MIYITWTTKRIQQFAKSWCSNFFQTWNGSACSCSFEPYFHKTDEEELWRRWLEVLASIDVASRAQNSNSPLLMWYWTVEIPSFSSSKLPKQMMLMMIGDECNKNFKVSSTIDEDWWTWRFCVLGEIDECERFSDPIWGIVKICYD